MARRSLRDRNSDAIARDPAAPPTPVPPVPQPLEPAPSAPSATPITTAPAASARTRISRAEAPAPPQDTTTPQASTARLGIYLTPQEFDDAKAAYLADWINGGQAHTFARWIAAAVDTEAARPPHERAQAQPRGRSTERTGSTRSFSIPTDTVARMRTAVVGDQQVGRWASDSAWCSEAIAQAVQNARTNNGGTLPTPPLRLPNRLTR